MNGGAAYGSEIHTIWEHTYQIYDAETGEWSQGPEPLVPRSTRICPSSRERLSPSRARAPEG